MDGGTQTSRSRRGPLWPPPLAAEKDALFLDLDGTLVAIAERPDAIQADAELRALLVAARARMGGRLVVVSGRTMADLDLYLGDSAPLAAGVHGAEIRGASPITVTGDVHRALARGRLVLGREGGELFVEDKGVAIALHYRHQPSLGALAGRLAAAIAQESQGVLAVQPGRMVFEIKPAQADKGKVVRTFLSEPAFAGARPIFVGDDLTDEAGFRAAAALGGFGVLVGDRSPTDALYALPDIRAVHAWLSELVKGLTR